MSPSCRRSTEETKEEGGEALKFLALVDLPEIAHVRAKCSAARNSVFIRMSIIQSKYTSIELSNMSLLSPRTCRILCCVKSNSTRFENPICLFEKISDFKKEKLFRSAEFQIFQIFVYFLVEYRYSIPSKE